MIVIDMDMPKSCEKCKLTQCYLNGKEWFDLKDDEKNYRTIRSDVGCLIKCDIEDIKAEIKAEMREHNGIDDFYTGIRCGLRYANGFINKHTK